MQIQTPWSRFAKLVNVVVVACFFLPFFKVSCQGMDVVTVSGVDLVIGGKPGGMIVDAANQPGGIQGGQAEIGNVDVEPLAIVALVLVVVGLGVSFVRSSAGPKASLAVSLAAIGVLVALYLKVVGTIKDEIAKAPTNKPDAAIASEMSKELAGDLAPSAESGMGLWGVAIGLVAIAGLAVHALKKPAA